MIKKKTWSRGKTKRPVIQVDVKTGKKVKEYPSGCEAAEESGFHYSGIQRCLRGVQKEYNGFSWGYKDVI